MMTEPLTLAEVDIAIATVSDALAVYVRQWVKVAERVKAEKNKPLWLSECPASLDRYVRELDELRGLRHRMAVALGEAFG